MNISKISIYITVIIIIAIISVPTFMKVIDTSNEKLLLVSDKFIIERAEKCVYEGNCKTNKITLLELKEKNYIEEEIYNPITKALYNDNSYVKITKDEKVFITN